MHPDELAWLDIEALHRAYRGGELTVGAVVEAALARIEALDPKLRAWSVVWAERARARARRLDERHGADEGALAPLFGVPVAVKDLCDVAGEPTRAGTVVLGDAPAPEDAEVVRRLEAAGAVLLGKTVMTEGAFVAHHPAIDPPLNPWSPARWTGISSSGSGVACAAGTCVAALGTDTGGSIRFPSAACGLTGLKPTHGRVSLRGVFPLAPSLDHLGPMARSAADAARVFAVLAGPDARDPWSLGARAGDADPVPPPATRGLRIGIDRTYCGEGVEAEVGAVLDDALTVWTDLGTELVELELPSTDEAVAGWVPIVAAEAAIAHAATYPERADAYGEALRAILELGRGLDGRAVAEAWQRRIAWSRQLETRLREVDALIAPVIPAAFPASTNLADVASAPAVRVAVRFTAPFDLSGSPSLTLPGGLDREGAPIGFQLVGRAGAERRLLGLGRAFQSATDWHSMHPALGGTA